ncbi:MAG: bifunctional methylenetetrahydrofolate dehydrogenase/methenyltetrahydrofolate cyclohydrolase FolD [Gemmataceae bacterium]|nr:bifunctional methylenetetrahydrofolate dehydrogenase/methenyltetrahydrofolate cyclohydrolase FolD [Gemmataceae bacterium]
MDVLLDGKKLAESMQSELAERVAARLKAGKTPPGLATVLVGSDPASQVYVRTKRRTCEKLGMTSTHYDLPPTVSQSELLALIAKLNADSSVHGILVQLPLPSHIEESAVIRAIDPRKDVDAFHPENLGLLAAGHPRFKPCTPAGVIELLVRNDIDPAGQDVVIVGRSNIVGKPLALLLAQKWPGGNATVTIAHTRTRDLAAHTRRADIVIAAAGQAGCITADMVKAGAVVVDVGTNRGPDGKLVGDVDFAGVAPKVRAISPVPGGVGPMTITMLMFNTLLAAG